MLINFSFTNYKSFRDNNCLSLSANKITEHTEHITSIGANKILPVSVIYGANASGKSNVYQAFEYMTEYVLNSFKFGGEDSKHNSEFEYMKPTPFILDLKSKESDSKFEVFFLDTSDSALKTYNYGFSINNSEVTNEWLSYKSKTGRFYRQIFCRTDKSLDLSGLANKYQENIRISLEKETLILSLGAKLKIPKLKRIRDWFLRNEFVDFGDPVQSLFLSRLLPRNFVSDENVQNDVVNFFSTFDDSIKGFRVEKVASDSDKDEENYIIDAIHSVIGSDEAVSIPLRYESDGTLKMFALYPRLQTVLENGGVLFIDELNARLHPLLVRNFIQTFLSPENNPKHAQLVFTTHDTWQLSSELLRRDEIWFTNKNHHGISELYSLSDVTDSEGHKIRKDEDYEKNYLLGKYHAVPQIKKIDNIRNKNQNGG